MNAFDLSTKFFHITSTLTTLLIKTEITFSAIKYSVKKQSIVGHEKINYLSEHHITVY